MHYTTISIVCLLSMVFVQITIEGNFMKCILRDPMPFIDLKESCDDNGISEQLHENNREAHRPEEECTDCSPRWNNLFTVLSPTAMVFRKYYYVIEGCGYKCTMQVNEWTLEMGIFWQPHTDLTTQFMPLTRFDCLNKIWSWHVRLRQNEM
jgi:hypothetical protein